MEGPTLPKQGGWLRKTTQAVVDSAKAKSHEPLQSRGKKQKREKEKLKVGHIKLYIYGIVTSVRYVLNL